MIRLKWGVRIWCSTMLLRVVHFYVDDWGISRPVDCCQSDSWSYRFPPFIDVCADKTLKESYRRECPVLELPGAASSRIWFLFLSFSTPNLDMCADERLKEAYREECPMQRDCLLLSWPEGTVVWWPKSCDLRLFLQKCIWRIPWWEHEKCIWFWYCFLLLCGRVNNSGCQVGSGWIWWRLRITYIDIHIAVKLSVMLCLLCRVMISCEHEHISFRECVVNCSIWIRVWEREFSPSKCFRTSSNVLSCFLECLRCCCLLDDCYHAS